MPRLAEEILRRTTSLPKLSAVWMTVRWMDDPGQEKTRKNRLKQFRRRPKYFDHRRRWRLNLRIAGKYLTINLIMLGERHTEYTILIPFSSFPPFFRGEDFSFFSSFSFLSLAIWPDKTQRVFAQPAYCASIKQRETVNHWTAAREHWPRDICGITTSILAFCWAVAGRENSKDTIAPNEDQKVFRHREPPRFKETRKSSTHQFLPRILWTLQ
jgi:hypothetical protein